MAKIKAPFKIDPANIHSELIKGEEGSVWLLIDMMAVGKRKQKVTSVAGSRKMMKRQFTPTNKNAYNSIVIE